MFGIGLPEMLVILAVGLIVVGPDKLPDLAKSVAKTILELKKTLNQVKASLADEENLLGSVKSDLDEAARDLKGNLLEAEDFTVPEPEKKPGEDTPPDREGVEAERRAPESPSAESESASSAPDTAPAAQDPGTDGAADGDSEAAVK